MDLAASLPHHGFMPKPQDLNFFELSQADLSELLKHGTERSFKKGEIIFNEGDEPDCLGMVKEGRVNMCKSTPEGGESLVAFYISGQSFCVAASIINDPFPCKAVAATKARVVSISAAKFKGLFDKLPRFARRLLSEMAPQFCAAHCDCAMSMESVERRLAHAVLKLDRQFQGTEIPFTRNELAQMVNTTVETCIRNLSEWEKRGWIESGRGHFRLAERGELENLIKGTSKIIEFSELF